MSSKTAESDITISIADAADAEDCRALLRDAFKEYVQRLGRSVGPEAYPLLGTAVAERRVLIATIDGRLCGVAVFHDQQNSRVLQQLGVRPDSQGLGIGGALLDHVEQAAIKRGLAYLELNTAEMMYHLVKLYEKRGFQIVRQGPPKHGLDDHPRVFMSKELVGTET